MIRVTVDQQGSVLRIRGVPQRATTALQRAIARETVLLANHVKTQKLSGQALKTRTGTLRRSVRAYPPAIGGALVRGDVAVDRVTSKYGKVHEYGGTYRIPAHMRRNRRRRTVSAGGVTYELRHLVREHTATFKERSFMRSSLEERRVGIVASIRRAVGEAVRAS